MRNVNSPAIFSVILPGIGQLYNGQILKWLKLTCLQILLTVLFPILFKLVGMISGFLFALGLLTIILLPFAFIPLLILIFGFVFAPRYSAYKDAIDAANQTTIWRKYFNTQQQLIIVILVTINEIIILMFLFKYFWGISEHLIR
ncbi:hypothetical protein [Paenibacillus sp. V4I7]|uniref:hypothetical protein n=1 Tax=Paenibacillus sp. V4I7 TaxID=3042307 RepID=UPI0027828F2C|nr:hypothetical protein [Paenibacillus sp. V4I7]MDQ0899936.1 sterol desaturase/sphingolipid hydroxylase (fatty acid hydroxylase superfamily) [Paenibacillus sp. V4I7]